MLLHLWNSPAFALGVMLGQLLIAVPTAFAFSYYDVHVKEPLSALVLVSLMVPFLEDAQHLEPVRLAPARGQPTGGLHPHGGGAALRQRRRGSNWGALMAAAVLATLPTVALYLLMRKQVLKTSTEGAVKG